MKNLRLWQVSEVRLTYYNRVQPADRPRIGCSQDAANVFRANWREDLEMCEEFNVLFLNKAMRVTGIMNLSKGGIESTVVDVRLLFVAALKALASGLVIAHNHPSCVVQPSEADVALTYSLQQAGDFLRIKVLDHLILSPYEYYSFADEGMLTLQPFQTY